MFTDYIEEVSGQRNVKDPGWRRSKAKQDPGDTGGPGVQSPSGEFSFGEGEGLLHLFLHIHHSEEVSVL